MEAPDKLHKLHDLLLNEGYTDVPKDYETFASKMQDRRVSEGVQKLLINNGYTDVPKDYDTFVGALGLKKKDVGTTSSSDGSGTSSAGSQGSGTAFTGISFLKEPPHPFGNEVDYVPEKENGQNLSNPVQQFVKSSGGTEIKPGSETEEFLKSEHQKNPQDILTNYELGRELLKNNKPNQALNFFQNVIEKNPDSYAGNFGMGSTMLRMGYADAAEDYFKKAVQSKPDSDAYHELALTQFEQKKYKDAQNTIEEALKLYPKDYELNGIAANIHNALGNKEQAKKYEDEYAFNQPLHDVPSRFVGTYKDENGQIKYIPRPGSDEEKQQKMANEMMGIADDLTKTFKAVNPAGELGEGIQSGIDNVKRSAELFSEGKIGQGTLAGTTGVLRMAFSAASSINPAFIAFNKGSQLGQAVLPEDISNAIFAPVQTVISKYYKNNEQEVPEWAKNAGELGDIVVQGALLHYGVKGAKGIIEKFKKNEPLTLEEAKTVTETLPKVSDEEIQKIVDNQLNTKENETQNGQKENVSTLRSNEQENEGQAANGEGQNAGDAENAQPEVKEGKVFVNGKEVPYDQLSDQQKKVADKLGYKPESSTMVETQKPESQQTKPLPIPERDKIEPEGNIRHNENFRAVNTGDWTGKEETPELEKKYKDWILSGDKLAGDSGNGETFDQFAGRVIDNWQKQKSAPDNTTIVTHSSVLKAIKAWEGMKHPESWGDMTDGQKQSFRDSYANEKSKQGDVESFNGDNGKINVVRHGETEDNLNSSFRRPNVDLTDKGQEQAVEAAKKLKEKGVTSEDHVISSDLPRAAHTANIIEGELSKSDKSENVKPEEKPITENTNQPLKTEENATRGRKIEDSVQEQRTGTNGRIQAEGEHRNEPPEGQEGGTEAGVSNKLSQEAGEPRLTGISHEAMGKASEKTGIESPERGTGTTPEAEIEKGRELLSKGKDPQEVIDKFKKDGTVSSEGISIMRAQQEKLFKEATDSYEQHGENSPQYKLAQKKLEDFQKELKPMQTEWHKIGMGMQGQTDIDTGSYVSMERAFKERYGRDLFETERKKVKELTSEVKKINEKYDELKKALDELHKKSIDIDNVKNRRVYTERAKRIADDFRKLKTKPFVFTDSNGNEIQVHSMGVTWNDAVEAGAKIIEATGRIADAVAAAIEQLKDADWFKNLSEEDKGRFADQLEQHLMEETDEGKKITRLEKELEALRNNERKLRKPAKPDSERAIELRKKIQSEKQKLKTGDLIADLYGKTDNKFTPEQAKGIWDYVKTYLDNGKDFNTAVQGSAVDLGLSARQVIEAINQPKTARHVTSNIYKNIIAQRQARQKAVDWLNKANKSGLEKIWNSIPDLFREVAIFGHGTVGMITHSGWNIFMPSRWGSYWKSFFRQYAHVISEGEYQRAVQEMVNDPDFMPAKKAGVKLDPEINSNTDDYTGFKKHFGRLSRVGDRGFFALQEYRLALWKKFYNSMPESAKASPETAKYVADLVNHATGALTSKTGASGTWNAIFFAPRLEASRWHRLFLDPAKAIAAYTYRYNKSTIAKKAAARLVFRNTGEFMAVYAAALAINQGINIASGSKDRVNLTDPLKADYLKFKIDGQVVDVTGGLINPVRLISQLYVAAQGDKKELHGKNRIEAAGSTMLKYARGKLSPFGLTVSDFALQHDIKGNTMFFSRDKPWSKYAYHQPWYEYLLAEKAPIPMAEAFNDIYTSMHEKGMNHSQINEVLNGILKGVISGGTGARVYEYGWGQPLNQKNH